MPEDFYAEYHRQNDNFDQWFKSLSIEERNKIIDYIHADKRDDPEMEALLEKASNGELFDSEKSK